MFTLADAQKEGWTLTADGEDGVAYLGDPKARAAAYDALAAAQQAYAEFAVVGADADQEQARLADEVSAALAAVGMLNEVHVTSATPLFSLLVNIAESEGKGFVAGYGGTAEITADLVKTCSGETLQPAAPPTPAQQAAQTATANAAAITQAITARLAQVRTARAALANGTIFAGLSAAEKAVLDGLLQNDIYLGRIALGLFEATT